MWQLECLNVWGTPHITWLGIILGANFRWRLRKCSHARAQVVINFQRKYYLFRVYTSSSHSWWNLLNVGLLVVREEKHTSKTGCIFSKFWKLRLANFQHNSQILSSYLNFSNALPLFTVLSKSKSHGLDLLNKIVHIHTDTAL